MSDPTGPTRAFDFPQGLLQIAAERSLPGDDPGIGDILAVGLPTTAVTPLIIAVGAAAGGGKAAVGGRSLLPTNQPYLSNYRFRVLSRKQQLNTALDDFRAATAAGVTYQQYHKHTQVEGDSTADETARPDAPAAPDTPQTPGEFSAEPQMATIRSGSAELLSRPVEADNLRVAPQDRNGRVLGMPSATADGQDEIATADLGAVRPITDPPLVFVADMALVVIPNAHRPSGVGPGLDEGHPSARFDPLGSDATGDDSWGDWLAVSVLSGEAALKLRERYMTGWETGSPVTLKTPPLEIIIDQAYQGVSERYARHLHRAFGEVTVSIRSLRNVGDSEMNFETDRPILEPKHIVLLVGAYTGEKRKDIVDAMQRAKFLSSTTIQRGMDELQDAGLVTTEPVPNGSRGRNPHKLVFTDESLADKPLADVLNRAARTLVQSDS